MSQMFQCAGLFHAFLFRQNCLLCISNASRSYYCVTYEMLPLKFIVHPVSVLCWAIFDVLSPFFTNQY